MQIAINPVLTTNAAGSFNTTSEGYVQGFALDSPSIRNSLAGGVLDADETLPLWGGVAISEYVPGSSPNDSLGSILKRATALTGANALTGFAVFDQNHSAVNSPQSAVPLVGQRMTANFYRLGSGARIAVKMDPSLVDLDGGLVTQNVSWDFENSMLVPYVAAYPANVITNAVWAAGQVTFTTTTPHGVGVGDDINISGFTPDEYNGSFVTLAGTAGSTIVVALADDPGADTVQGQLDAGGGNLENPLSVRVLGTQVANSMTVDYDADTGFANWNRSGSCAIILI